MWASNSMKTDKARGDWEHWSGRLPAGVVESRRSGRRQSGRLGALFILGGRGRWEC